MKSLKIHFSSFFPFLDECSQVTITSYQKSYFDMSDKEKSKVAVEILSIVEKLQPNSSEVFVLVGSHCRIECMIEFYDFKIFSL